MALPVSDQIANGLRRHRVRVMRVSEGMVRDATRAIGGLRVELVKVLSANDPTEPTRLGDQLNRVDTATAEAKPVVGKQYRTMARSVHSDTLEVAAADQHAVEAVIERAGDYAVDTLPTRTLERIAERALVEGAPLSEWWRRQSADVVKRFHDQIRQGTQAGESIGQLITRIRGTAEKEYADGILAVPQRQAEALVRTSVMSTLNDAQVEQFKQNSDVIEGWAVLTTFDDRTCEECMAYSGAMYDHNGEPLPGSPVQEPLPSAGLPLHVSCRCVPSPILIGEPAPEDLSYEAWLTDQPEAVQIEVLGPKWFEAWKSGDLPSLSDRVDQRGRPLRLDQFVKPPEAA